MKPFQRICIFLFLFSSFGIIQANSRVNDSLLKITSSKKHDTIRIQAYILLGENMYPDFPDSCVSYWTKAIHLCNNSFKKATSKEKRTLTILKGTSFNNIAIIYLFKGNIQMSLDYNFKALKMREESKDLHGIAESMNNISTVYAEQGDTAAAVKFLKKSRNFYRKINDVGGVAYTCLNMSKIFITNKQDSLALKYLYEAKNILEHQKHLKVGLANCLTIISSIDQRKGNLKKAKKNILQGLKLRLEVKDNQGLALSYTALADYYLLVNNVDSALYNANKAMESAKIISIPETISQAASILSKVYKKMHDFERSLEYYTLYIQMRDSINNNKTQKAMVKNQLRYQYETKAATDSLRHAQESKVREAKLEKEKVQRYALYIGLIIVIAFLLFLYSRFRIIRSQKNTIEHQKKIVDIKNKEMLDSIYYARQIQGALLPSNKILNEEFADHFILFKPKDIVSGDFYWTTKKETKQNEFDSSFYLAVCDSTGHGVPGAFMSLLNISFLNEGIIEKNIHAPNEVLDYVRMRLIENISQEGAQDGMDATLMCYEKHSMKISYASAHNKGVLIRNGELIELNADKMPVGKGEIKHPFTLNVLEVQKNDLLYFYTDGFPDQFGGPKGKKFKSSNLNKLILEVSQLPMKDQQTLFDQRFESWKHDLEQLDDVCMIGIKI